MYDPKSEAHEFIGRDRAEAIAKATTFFAAEEADLAVSEVDATSASGIGTRFVLVAYLRSGRAPRRPSDGEGRRGAREEREPRGERGPREGRGEGRGRERSGRERERGERGERGGRGRSRRDEEPRAARRDTEAAAELGPSSGTPSTPLGEIGEFVRGLVERMGAGPFEISESGAAEGLIALALKGPAAERLAAGDGRAVDAIQLLANQASLRASGDDAKRVVVEVEGNTDQRTAFLERIAERAAARARETGRPVALEAMSPRERRVVHVALRDEDGIATMSVGEGRYRQVVVVPESAPEYEEAKRYESGSRE